MRTLFDVYQNSSRFNTRTCVGTYITREAAAEGIVKMRRDSESVGVFHLTFNIEERQVNQDSVGCPHRVSILPNVGRQSNASAQLNQTL
jgi:hypothetical protein